MGFTSDQTNQMAKRTFKALDSTQLAKLSKDAVTGLTSGQLKTLSSEEIIRFKPVQIKSIDKNAISGIKPDALNTPNKLEIRSIDSSQLVELSNKQIRKAGDFINALTDRELQSLSLVSSRPERSMNSSSDDIVPLLNSMAKNLI